MNLSHNLLVSQLHFKITTFSVKPHSLKVGNKRMANSIVYIVCCNFLFKVLDFAFIKYIKTLVLHLEIWIMRLFFFFLVIHIFRKQKKAKTGVPLLPFRCQIFLRKAV